MKITTDNKELSYKSKLAEDEIQHLLTTIERALKNKNIDNWAAYGDTIRLKNDLNNITEYFE